jgi:predicted nucleotidyltransferase
VIIRGAGSERSPERPIATIAQVDALADAIEPRWRALVLLATYGSLRWGELTALTRRRFDLTAGTVEVVEQALELASGQRVLGPPKIDAGRRVVSLPAFVVDELVAHLAKFVEPGPDAIVFTGPKGAPLLRSNWHPKWKAAAAAVGCEDLHFHDLRHTGNTLAAATRASTKELMARIGHSSARAALLYQHATRERDDAIAVALDAMARPGRAASVSSIAGRPGRTLPYPLPMPVRHHVDAEGRYDGKTLQELWPVVVDEVVAAVDPLEVILFGSVARGEDGPDSDIDLLVVLDRVASGEKRLLMARIRSAIATFAPVDVFVTDPAEMAERRDDVGSLLYWPLREGRPVYRRKRVRAV